MVSMKSMVLRITATVIFGLPVTSYAIPGIMKKFIDNYPEVKDSQLASCRTCHLPMEKDCLNRYGLDLRDNSLNFRVIEDKDSDEDGAVNIDEIRNGQLPGSQARPDEVFIFTNRIGAVTFDHEKHSLAKEYVSEGKCSNCHNEEGFPRKFYDNSSWQNIAHPLCRGCHKKSDSADAPRLCFECHDKDATSKK